MTSNDDCESSNPNIDPTKNVKSLVDTAVRRLDDLRTQSEIHHERIAQVREQYQEKLRLAESGRIDAIRAVDVDAVGRAAVVSAQQASTLAVQVATSAETLRTQVGAAATASDIRLQAALEPMIKDIADLRRAQYEAQGVRAQVVETRDVRVERSGTSSNYGMWIGLAIAVVGTSSAAILGVAGIIGTYLLSK